MRFANANGGRIRLLESRQRWTICDINGREFKGPPGIIATTGIELSTMVRKCKQVFSQKNLEAGSRSL